MQGFVPEYLPYNDDTQMNSTQFIETMNIVMAGYPTYPEGTSEAGIDALLFEYTNWEDIEDKDANIAQLDHAISDRDYRCDAQKTADIFTEAGLPVYFYEFAQRFENHYSPEWFGVAHGDDTFMVYGSPFDPYDHGIDFTDRERILSVEMMKHWANFAKTGYVWY